MGRFRGWERVSTWFTGRRARWLTVAVWVVAAIVMTAVLPSISKVESPNPANLPTTASSVQASKIENGAFPGTHASPGLLVFYRRGGLMPKDYAGIAQFLSRLDRHRLPDQTGSVPYVGVQANQLHRLALRSGTTLVVPLLFHQTGDSRILSAIKRDTGRSLQVSTGQNLLRVSTASGHLSARLTGPTGIAIDTTGLFKNADVTLLAGTTVLILVLLLLIYRSPLLPWIPLLSVGLSYAVTSGILSALVRAHAIVVDAETISIMTVLMFGAGTDYTLFVVSRYRRELWRHQDPIQALRPAYRDVSGAVAMSAGTVMAALLTLLVSVYGSDHRFAVPFAVGVGMTALASLTLVPALLSILGRPAFWPYTPKVGKTAPKGRTWLAALVTRRAWPVAIGAVILLGGLAINAGHIRTTYNLLSELPASSQSVQGFRLLSRAEGPGALSPVAVVVEGPAAHHTIEKALLGSPGVTTVQSPRFGYWKGSSVAVYQVEISRNPLSESAMQQLGSIRHAALQALPAGTHVYLGGETSQNADSRAAIAHDTHWVIPLVLAIIFVLLLVYLRSIVAAVYLILTVILSFFAALGAGWILLHNVLGISGWAGGVTLYAFVFLVALGEDYNIFMLSAIWSRRREAPMTDAIRWGIRTSGPVISAAGLILAGTFAVLTGLPLRILLEFGSVAAIGVLLDTFVVRSLLVPAITTILGDWALWPSTPRPAARVADHSFIED